MCYLYLGNTIFKKTVLHDFMDPCVFESKILKSIHQFRMSSLEKIWNKNGIDQTETWFSINFELT